MTILRNPSLWLGISIATIIGSLLVIFIIGPTWGIDFTGGSLIEVPADTSNIPAVQSLLEEKFNMSPLIQPTQDGTILIRMETISEDTHSNIIAAFEEAQLTTGEERRFESIGPTIGKELQRKSLSAISLTLVVMIAYLAYEFRGIRGLLAPWKFGIAAVYALFHDLIFVTAAFVIFGKIWGATIDTLFVTAQLAILGYSVNDTIIIFNRMKWEWIQDKSQPLLTIMNNAMIKTLARSLNTSFTILLVLLALLVFGGSTIHWFIAALTLGTIVGSYSSLYVAAPLLHYLGKR